MAKKSKTKSSSKPSLNNNFYLVNKVHATRRLPDGTQQCYVSWVGYPQSENSWVRKETVMEKKTYDKGIYETLSVSKKSSEREGSSSLKPKKLTKSSPKDQSDSVVIKKESESDQMEDSQEYAGLGSNKYMNSGLHRRKNSERSQRLQAGNTLRKSKKIQKKQKIKQLDFTKEFHFDFQTSSDLKSQPQYSFKIDPLNTESKFGIEMRELGVQTEDFKEQTLRRLRGKKIQFDLPCLTNTILRQGAKKLQGNVLWY